MDREPGRLASDTTTTTAGPAADSTNGGSQGNDGCEPITSDSPIAQEVLGDFHGGIASQQSTQDAFPRCQLGPQIGRCQMPVALGQEINGFGSQQGSGQCRQINREQSGIAPR